MESLKKAPIDVTNPSLDDLIQNGPLNKDDITYNNFVATKASLKPLEEGWEITKFSKGIEEHDVLGEWKVLRAITFDKKMQAMLNMEDDLQQFNRYCDILPFTRNPITLAKDTHGSNSYINASFLSSSINGDEKSFICCQSPLDNTIVDFWRMVINQGINTIIMLCKIRAGNRPQSSQYFPTVCDASFTDFKGVKLISKEYKKDVQITIRTFLLEVGKGETREVLHYQWEGWPDHGVPEQRQYGVILDLVNVINERRKLFPNLPIMVHCSAGVGRSGTVVAIHNIAQIIKAYRQKVATHPGTKANISIFSVVRRLREQRISMVQTKEQYILIYEMILTLLENPKLLNL
jgi:receptor-type tyrosine-protein phosphatase gamma